MKLERLLAGQQGSRDMPENPTRPSTTDTSPHHDTAKSTPLAPSHSPVTMVPNASVQPLCFPGQLAGSPPVTTTMHGVNTGCSMVQAPFVTTTAVTWSNSVMPMPNKLTVSSLLHMRDTKRQTKSGAHMKNVSGAKLQAPPHVPGTTAAGSDVYDFKDDDDEICEKPSLQRRFDRKLLTPQNVSCAPNWTPEGKVVVDMEAGSRPSEHQHEAPVSAVAAPLSMTVSASVEANEFHGMDRDTHQWPTDWADAVKSRDHAFEVSISGQQQQAFDAADAARQTDPQKEVSLTQDVAATFVPLSQHAANAGSLFHGREGQFAPPSWAGISSVDYNTLVSSAGTVPNTCFPAASVATSQVPAYTAQTQSVYSSASFNSAMYSAIDTFIAALEKESKRTSVSSTPTAFPVTPHLPATSHPNVQGASFDGVTMPTGGMWPVGAGSHSAAVVDGCKLDMSRADHQLVSEALTMEESELLSRLEKNNVEEVPRCDCVGAPPHEESKFGPYYTHLGAGPTVAAVRQLMEHRLGINGKALRMEKVRYTGKEGKSPQGCPVAKWIIRRSGPDEKVLCIVRPRPGHYCCTAVMLISIVIWDGVPKSQADQLYDYVRCVVPKYGFETERRCGTNEPKTCACQGWDAKTGGASFSFGCSWSMYYNGCKFAKSPHPRKFKLSNEEEEPVLRQHLQQLATHVGSILKTTVPNTFRNMTQFENEALDCRLGNEQGRPYGGVTAVVDFCTHSHKDQQNMNNGCTTVVTLTKHRGYSKPEDEQLHVLPMCVLDASSEEGNCMTPVEQKIKEGALECLQRYPMKMRIRATPLLSKKKRKMSNSQYAKRRGAGRPPKWPRGPHIPHVAKALKTLRNPRKPLRLPNGQRHRMVSNKVRTCMNSGMSARRRMYNKPFLERRPWEYMQVHEQHICKQENFSAIDANMFAYPKVLTAPLGYPGVNNTMHPKSMFSADGSTDWYMKWAQSMGVSPLPPVSQHYKPVLPHELDSCQKLPPPYNDYKREPLVGAMQGATSQAVWSPATSTSFPHDQANKNWFGSRVSNSCQLGADGKLEVKQEQQQKHLPPMPSLHQHQPPQLHSPQLHSPLHQQQRSFSTPACWDGLNALKQPAATKRLSDPPFWLPDANKQQLPQLPQQLPQQSPHLPQHSPLHQLATHNKAMYNGSFPQDNGRYGPQPFQQQLQPQPQQLQQQSNEMFSRGLYGHTLGPQVDPEKPLTCCFDAAITEKPNNHHPAVLEQLQQLPRQCQQVGISRSSSVDVQNLAADIRYISDGDGGTAEVVASCSLPIVPRCFSPTLRCSMGHRGTCFHGNMAVSLTYTPRNNLHMSLLASTTQTMTNLITEKRLVLVVPSRCHCAATCLVRTEVTKCGRPAPIHGTGEKWPGYHSETNYTGSFNNMATVNHHKSVSYSHKAEYPSQVQTHAAEPLRKQYDSTLYRPQSTGHKSTTPANWDDLKNTCHYPLQQHLQNQQQQKVQNKHQQTQQHQLLQNHHHQNHQQQQQQGPPSLANENDRWRTQQEESSQCLRLDCTRHSWRRVTGASGDRYTCCLRPYACAHPQGNTTTIYRLSPATCLSISRSPQRLQTSTREVFRESDIGGVAIALTHGSVLFEVAKRELHATTAMKKPNRYHPTRISLVFYQHKNLNLPSHGHKEYEVKQEMWKKRRDDRAPRGGRRNAGGRRR
ncbi:hypothetical protein LSAT2_022746 [Lamellibrachia satsuma]|nr:hypothetical protein LSAT2_022746 [Lamellibrachia satsuma]